VTPDLPLLRALVALVDTRSTTQAARRLHLSQPTLSGMLARLRTDLGDPLLVRAGRGMEPTARALALVAALRPHLDAIDGAIAATLPFDPATATRTFRVGMTDAVAEAALPRLMPGLIADAPGCRLIVRIGDWRSFPDMLAAGEIATAAGFFRTDPPANARTRVLVHAPWVVLRDAAAPPVTDAAAFATRPHALVSPLGDVTGVVDAPLAALGLTRWIAVAVTSFGQLPALLPGTGLIATVPDFLARAMAPRAGLAIDPLPVTVPPVTNRLVWRAGADGDAGEAWFRARLTDAFLQ
jgi:LysR family transcriptional regulator, mexEF-oprN operon transcriptional activator